MSLIHSLYTRLRDAWPANRVVVLLTPVFTAAAGYVASWTAANLPGLPPLDEGWLAGVFVAGGAAAIAAVYRWLDGWQQYERRINDRILRDED